jgi:hypothetical protein
MGTLYEVNNLGNGRNTTKTLQKSLKDANIGRLNIIPRFSWKNLVTNDSTNDEDPIDVPKIWKPKSGIRKPRGSDIKWSNLLGDHATHFDGYTESPNVNNSSYNRKNARTTSDA